MTNTTTLQSILLRFAADLQVQPQPTQAAIPTFTCRPATSDELTEMRKDDLSATHAAILVVTYSEKLQASIELSFDDVENCWMCYAAFEAVRDGEVFELLGVSHLGWDSKPMGSEDLEYVFNEARDALLEKSQPLPAPCAARSSR